MQQLAWAASRQLLLPSASASRDRCIRSLPPRSPHPHHLRQRARGPTLGPRSWRIAPEGFTERSGAPPAAAAAGGRRAHPAAAAAAASMALAAPALARAQLGASESSALSSRQHAGSAGKHRRRWRAAWAAAAALAAYPACAKARQCTASFLTSDIFLPRYPQHTACLRPAAARLPRRQRRVAAAAAAADAKPQRRVVVTGQGVVTSLGHTPDEFYNNLLAGKSGISMIEGWDTGAPCT